MELIEIDRGDIAGDLLEGAAEGQERLPVASAVGAEGEGLEIGYDVLQCVGELLGRAEVESAAIEVGNGGEEGDAGGPRSSKSKMLMLGSRQ